MREKYVKIQNAKFLTREQLVRTFVATELFWDASEAKNQIIFGTRGSGKTALGRMISHRELSEFASTRRMNQAEAIIRKQANIGTYIACSDLVEAPENLTGELAGWLVNVATTAAFLTTAESCFRAYPPIIEPSTDSLQARQLNLEAALLEKLVRKLWLDGDPSSFAEARRQLDDLKRDRIRWGRLKFGFQSPEAGPTPPGLGFDLPLQDVLDILTSCLSEVVQISPAAKWSFCFDEAEFLDRQYILHLNAFLRTAKPNIFLKVITLPYAVLEDTPYGEPLVPGRDYDPLYLDSYLREKWTLTRLSLHETFANEIYSLRVPLIQEVSGREIELPQTLRQLLGTSTLYDRALLDQALNVKTDEDRLTLMAEHCSPELVMTARSQAQSNRPFFLQSTWNKTSRHIYMRIEKARPYPGNRLPEHYSGLEMVVRIFEGNVGNLICIIDSLVEAAREEHRTTSARKPAKPYRISSIPARTQAQVLLKFAAELQAKYHKTTGANNSVVELLDMVAKRFQQSLYGERLSKDVASSIRLPDNKDVQSIALAAVKVGILYPNHDMADGPRLPPLNATSFRFAGGLAPHYDLLPERGVEKVLDLSREEVKSLTIKLRPLEAYDNG